MFAGDESSVVSLLSLPVEVLHRIFDFLDTESLLISLRSVCVSLYDIVQTYNRYRIICRSMNKIHLCRLIPPPHVIQLDFLDRHSACGWTLWFISNMDIYQFTRLRSLSLYKFNQDQLRTLLHHVTMHCQLTSLEIHSDIPMNDDEKNSDLFQFLSLIIAQPTLISLLLHFDLSNKHTFSWPARSHIKKLTIGLCTLEQVCSILDQSPYLHTMIMDNCYANDLQCSISFQSHSYPQLRSLTFNDLRMTMNKLELLLSLLPSLNHLDLTSTGKPFEFIRRLSQWEDFLQRHLPELSRLEFCIFCYGSSWEDFERLIDTFRTAFWLEEKRWFVTCQFRDDWTTSFTAFTSSESSIRAYQKQEHFDRVLCYHSRETEVQ